MIGYELAFGVFSDDDGFLEVVWDGIDSRVAVTFRGEGQCEYAAWGPNTEPTTGHKGITQVVGIVRPVLDTLP